MHIFQVTIVIMFSVSAIIYDGCSESKLQEGKSRVKCSLVETFYQKLLRVFEYVFRYQEERARSAHAHGTDTQDGRH